MPWNVKDQQMEVNYDFKKAIPKDATTWVRIDKVRPGANAIMESTFSDATLVYRAGEVHQRQTVHWEKLKFVGCYLTLIETNFEKNGEPLFPTRKKRSDEVSRDEFERAWKQLLPLEITDEWMAAVLNANPTWYDMLRLWIPIAWMRKWMPEKLEEQEDEITGEKREVAKKEETLGEDSSD